VKKPVLIALVAAAVLATAWFVWSRMGGGETAAAAALDAETTLAAAGLEPTTAWKSTARMLDALPGLAVDNAELKLFTPAAVTERLGFDPATVEGWASVGIDSTAGFTVAADAKTFAVTGGAGSPIFLLRLTDRAKAFAWLEKVLGTPVKLTDEAGPSAVLNIGSMRLLLGERRGLTAIAVPVADADPAASRPAFDAFLTAGGTPLQRDDAWRAAFADARPPLTSWLFLGSRGGELWEKSLKLPSEIDVGVAHYAKLFPALAAWNWFEGEPGGMLVASPEAVRAMEQIMRPRKAPPKFTEYMPAAAGLAFRWSVNLVELTSGVSALLPPNAPPQLRMGLEMGKAFLPMQIGVSWTEITEAISGHFAVAVDVSKISAGDLSASAAAVVALAGVQGAEKADALLTKLANTAKEKLSTEISAVDINGAKGYHVGPAAEGFTVVRKGDVLVAGVHEAVDSAVRGTAGLSDPTARALDEDVCFATWWDAEQMLSLLGKADFPQRDAAVAFLRGQLGGVKGQSVDARLVGNGLRFDGVGGAGVGGATTFLGLIAAFAVPVVQKRTDESRTSEAVANLERMARGAVVYYEDQKVDQTGVVQPRQFPGGGVLITAPEDWHTQVCPPAGPARYTPDAETFSHPVFKALGFQLAAPFAYQYQFVAEGSGTSARFTARAVGDLDCDGVYSTFEKTGRVGPEGEVVLDPGLFRRDELE
jgi:hypothetical protein